MNYSTLSDPWNPFRAITGKALSGKAAIMNKCTFSSFATVIAFEKYFKIFFLQPNELLLALSRN
jgi:hypothetical protein